MALHQAAKGPSSPPGARAVRFPSLSKAKYFVTALSPLNSLDVTRFELPGGHAEKRTWCDAADVLANLLHRQLCGIAASRPQRAPRWLLSRVLQGCARCLPVTLFLVILTGPGREHKERSQQIKWNAVRRKDVSTKVEHEGEAMAPLDCQASISMLSPPRSLETLPHPLSGTYIFVAILAGGSRAWPVWIAAALSAG